MRELIITLSIELIMCAETVKERIEKTLEYAIVVQQIFEKEK